MLWLTASRGVFEVAIGFFPTTGLFYYEMLNGKRVTTEEHLSREDVLLLSRETTALPAAVETIISAYEKGLLVCA